jgi:hypothetical protein
MEAQNERFPIGGQDTYIGTGCTMCLMRTLQAERYRIGRAGGIHMVIVVPVSITNISLQLLRLLIARIWINTIVVVRIWRAITAILL